MEKQAAILFLALLGSSFGAKIIQNAAVMGTATQSTHYPHGWAQDSKTISGWAPNRAIDGNRDNNWYHGSCATTSGKDVSPWWRVDLLKTYKVASISIWSRADCCPYQLNGAEIHIGNSLRNNGMYNPRCAVFYTSKGVSQTFQCNWMVGRYVTIVIPGKKVHLVVCEVEVKGSVIA